MFPNRQTTEPSSEKDSATVDAVPAAAKSAAEALFEKTLPPAQKTAEAQSATAVPTAEAAEPTQAELERLRDILFGSQARSTDRRMTGLETTVAALRQELTQLVEQKVGALANNATSQVSTTNRELGDRLVQQAADQNSRLRAAQEALNT
ncbi:MAG: hypothetical protein KC425_09725 [Anaerolineales bacterium]|nr:hypothetical protein [Anaerolineales bacterium]